MTIANSYKPDLKENSENNTPMEKETGRWEAQEEEADGEDGVDGVEEAEAEVAGEEGVEEEVEVQGEGEDEGEEEEVPLEELPEPNEHVLQMMNLIRCFQDVSVDFLELKQETKAGGLFYIMMIQIMTILCQLRILWILVHPDQAEYVKWQKKPGLAISWDGIINS